MRSNYGSNKVQFTNAVPAGSRIRLRRTIAHAEAVPEDGVRVTSAVVVEIEGQPRPALVGEIIAVHYG